MLIHFFLKKTFNITTAVWDFKTFKKKEINLKHITQYVEKYLIRTDFRNDIL